MRRTTYQQQLEAVRGAADAGADLDVFAQNTPNLADVIEVVKKERATGGTPAPKRVRNGSTHVQPNRRTLLT